MKKTIEVLIFPLLAYFYYATQGATIPTILTWIYLFLFTLGAFFMVVGWAARKRVDWSKAPTPEQSFNQVMTEVLPVSMASNIITVYFYYMSATSFGENVAWYLMIVYFGIVAPAWLSATHYGWKQITK